MSKETDNKTEKHNKSTMLFMLFTSLAILSTVIGLFYHEQWSEEFRTASSIIGMILYVIAAWFAFKMFQASLVINKDKKLQKQMSDERAIEVDYKSRATGYLGCLISATFYAICAVIQKVLFSSNYLLEINGLYIALGIIAIGSLVTTYSQYSQEKE